MRRVSWPVLSFAFGSTLVSSACSLFVGEPFDGIATNQAPTTVDASSEAETPPTTDDAGTAASDTKGDADAAPEVCPRPAPTTYLDRPNRPAAEGACTASEVVTGTELVKQSASLGELYSALSDDCASCVISAAEESTWATFVLSANSLWVNTGRCLEIEGYSAACAKAAQRVEYCKDIVCGCLPDADERSTCKNDATNNACAAGILAIQRECGTVPDVCFDERVVFVGCD